MSKCHLSSLDFVFLTWFIHFTMYNLKVCVGDSGSSEHDMLQTDISGTHQLCTAQHRPVEPGDVMQPLTQLQHQGAPLQLQHKASDTHACSEPSTPSQQQAAPQQLQNPASDAHAHQQPVHPQQQSTVTASNPSCQASDTHSHQQPLHSWQTGPAFTASYQLLHAYLQQSAEQVPPQHAPHQQGPYQHMSRQDPGSLQQDVSSTAVQQESGSPVSMHSPSNKQSTVSVREAQQVAAKLAASVNVQSLVQSPVSASSAAQSPQEANSPQHSPAAAKRTHQQPYVLQSYQEPALSSAHGQQQPQVESDIRAKGDNCTQLQTSALQQSQPHTSSNSPVSRQPESHRSSARSDGTTAAQLVFGSSQQTADLQEQADLAHALITSMQEQPSVAALGPGQALNSPATAGQAPNSPATAALEPWQSPRSATQERSPSNSISQAADTDSYASPMQCDHMGYYADSPASSITQPSSSSSASGGHASSHMLPLSG